MRAFFMTMNSTQHGAVEQTEQTLSPPRKYAVVLKNDDYTPMDFVVDILLNIFVLSEAKAVEVMLQVHHQGRGVAGTFSREVAETKVAMALKAAHEAGHPFLCSVEAV